MKTLGNLYVGHNATETWRWRRPPFRSLAFGVNLYVEAWDEKSCSSWRRLCDGNVDGFPFLNPMVGFLGQP
jgi:hypothetical protein